MNLYEYTLPAHWACALVNDDRSGMTNEEEAQLAAWFDYTFPDGAHCVAVSEEYGDNDPGFLVDHDARAHGAFACDCLVFTFDVAQAR